jgi:hypothetical protein
MLRLFGGTDATPTPIPDRNFSSVRSCSGFGEALCDPALDVRPRFDARLVPGTFCATNPVFSVLPAGKSARAWTVSF